MYKSPIEIIATPLQIQRDTQCENEIVRAVQNIGVNVDKAELKRALQYDRNQYNEGYKDGVREFAARLKARQQLMAKSVYCEPEKAVTLEDVNEIMKSMTGASEDEQN